MEKIIHLEEEIEKALQASENYEEWVTFFFNSLQEFPPSQQICQMILNRFIVSQFRRDYYVFFAASLCLTNRDYRAIFEHMFKNIYETISPGESDLHRIYEEMKFFAILFHRDSISWSVLSCIKLKENFASTREYFVTLLLLELSRNLGSKQLCERLKTLEKELDGLLPKDKLENTLYAIKLFELVDLHDLTYDLYQHVNSVKNEELTHQIQNMSL